MPSLDAIDHPRDLKDLTPDELAPLAAELREVLIGTVAGRGGHLGPNLGVVELTIALHRVFDSPADRILFDTGHQAYVHKLLTGRRAAFDGLRRRGGLSGYPSRAESEHDVIENSHASTALSYADGLAKAEARRAAAHRDGTAPGAYRRRNVVALIGDGALTGGMAWEALNNIAAAPDRPVVIVVNDNGRSYAPTAGALARHLAALRTAPRYERALEFGKRALGGLPPVYRLLHGVKRGLADMVLSRAMFTDLGLKYIGPVDGHDVQDVERALRQARDFGGPVVVHCVTVKGRGYAPAEGDDDERMHSPGPFDVATGALLPKAGPSWTGVFSEELVKAGAERPDVVAITAAMPGPTGLSAFAAAHPDRTYDVGIAEQHAVASAAGLAMGGLHPVVAIYSTFVNRAFDQVLMDVALHRLPVTLVLDRAGVTGDDGASHNGMWDLSILQVVPGLRIAAPRDAARLRALLGEALDVADGPTAVRFPKGPAGEDVEAVERIGGLDVLAREGAGDAGGAGGAAGSVLLVAVGAMAATCLETARAMAAGGVATTVVDPRWVKPLDDRLRGLAAAHDLVAVVEDSGRVGGAGDAVARLLRDGGVDVPVRTFGIPQRFLGHARRPQILDEIGLTPAALADAIGAALAGRGTEGAEPALSGPGRHS
ncbi:1-deoxy-D-xylulose-5-phosphate synthase [Actinomadura sp. PM05-2]|uniref:1-deoxy-D-xylulose-5-phosphate synthase n=1 Tax=Actinomadura parmotrematis TaxID=2864039 RepID=A0ABS7G1L6_9ACTN|nr:1-deoxy-D-xylulose-5-phosphate synthase [Actinomadura parmotrematis]MBW8486451.1 1-deoxy-D-xylulose-5-phosphate synthase [Actinomadura parmotrematis]